MEFEITMTDRSHSLCSCCVVVILLLGCDRTPITPPTPAPLTKLGIQTRRLAPFFVDEVGKLTEEFKVVNQTDAPLQFVNVLKSCTCTDARLEKSSLLPNESTVLRLVVHPAGRPGKNLVSCTLVDQGGAKRGYSVSFDGYQRVTFSRPELSFGRVACGEEQSLPFHVMSYSIGEIPPSSLVELAADDPEIRLTQLGEELLELDGGVSVRRFAVRVLLSPIATRRSRNSTVRVRVRSGDQSHSASCPVSWTVSSPFSVVPPRLFISDLQREDVHHNQITVRRADSQPFRILSVTASDPAIKVARISDEDGQVESVSVTLSGADLAKPYSIGTIAVTTDSVGSNSSFEIPFAIRRKE